ncbi:MAG TPA: MaoC family dehydratase [Hellea balneolensis]|uniref:MaoC family dehydratase n=1 Tax=Hellea balneolensis TaxID=287478 RepID=A0A7V5U1I3_9PROT|nr:MaoC family dehydratase [Hellea balneolensis]
MSVLEHLSGQIGQELGVSDWIEISQERINTFADVTEDHQFIHVNPEMAKQFTPFGGTIAHGFLTLSLLSRMAETGLPKLEGAKMGMNYGLNKVRFLTPVPSGARVRGRFVLASAEEKNPGQILQCHTVTVEIDGAPKPALVADWLSLIFV